ncbi:MAG: DUF4190 domain-containing protein [Candidatus Saccharimonadales bacterium]
MTAAANKVGSGFGIASMVLGIVSLFGLGVLTGIPAIILGIIAIRKHKGAGFGMGIAGVVTGAIGILVGIIFVMTFIALPSLQGSQRDTQAKSDISFLNSAITAYSSNNRGSFPSDDEFTGGSFATSNLDGGFTKKIVINELPTTSTIVFVRGMKCPEDGSVTGDRFYSLKTLLNNGSEYCLSN